MHDPDKDCDCFSSHDGYQEARERVLFVGQAIGALIFFGLATIVMLCLATSVFAQGYDATSRIEKHAKLGVYDSGGVSPMVVIYETDLFSNKKHLPFHFPNRNLPDGKTWKKKLQDNPGVPVMLNWEKRPENPVGFDEYRAACLRYMMNHAHGIREYWYYGAPWSPRSRFEKSAATAFQKSKEARDAKLMALCDGYAVQCYYRWEKPGDENYEIRCKYKRLIAELSGHKSIAVYWPRTHNLNRYSEWKFKPIPATQIKVDLSMLQDTFDGVVIWDSPPTYKPEEELPIDDSNRLLALGDLK